MKNNEPVIRFEHISMQFPGVLANDDVSLEIRRGEVFALIGENGAGKSTLMNILYGIQTPSSGAVYIKGRLVESYDPKNVIAQGVGMVHQHFMLVPSFTVAQNIVMSREPRKHRIFFDNAAAEEAARKLEREYGLTVPETEPVEDISVGLQQRVEILKALYRGAEILILDEPTAVLTPQETEVFFQTLRQMRDDGKSIILITHKLEEIISIVDEVTDLRDGQLIGHRKVDETVTKDDLSRMMVGRDVLFRFPPVEKQPGEVRLRMEGLTALSDKGVKALKDFTLELREGEIVGLAGVDGNGQKELCEVLTGLRRAEAGRLLLSGEDVTNRSPDFYIGRRVSHIPEDRHSTGLAMNWSLKKNLVLKQIGRAPFARGLLMREKEIQKNWEKMRTDYQIKAISGDDLSRSLSGGNQQKVILARELDSQPEVLVANQPTRGLDIGASEYVRSRILEARNGGTSVLLVSADLEELLQLSDRIAVIYGGELMGILPRGADAMEIGSMMMGKRQEVAQA